jgi:hypothetical protein
VVFRLQEAQRHQCEAGGRFHGDLHVLGRNGVLSVIRDSLASQLSSARGRHQKDIVSVWMSGGIATWYRRGTYPTVATSYGSPGWLHRSTGGRKAVQHASVAVDGARQTTDWRRHSGVVPRDRLCCWRILTLFESRGRRGCSHTAYGSQLNLSETTQHAGWVLRGKLSL